jgi:hypothetical protein
MRTLLYNSKNELCPRRIGFYLFGITAIIGFFLKLDPYLTGLFLAASIGKSWLLTTQR